MKVHSFESLAALDGEGLRYGVFLVGCPLRCAYCHNPDTWTETGTEYSIEALLKKILRYRPYFGKRGGVTFSGGEPLLQAKEISLLGERLKEYGVDYTLDTSGALPLTEPIQRATDGAALVICDLKMTTKEDFRRYMQGDLSLVKNYLDYLKETNKRAWIRTVVVPGLNDREEAIEKYVAIVKNYPNVEKYELLAFHTMGFYKYEALSAPNPLKDTPPLSQERLASLQAYADELLRR